MVQWQTAGPVMHKTVGSTYPCMYMSTHINTHAAVFKHKIMIKNFVYTVLFELISNITNFALGKALVSVSDEYNFIFNLFKSMYMCVNLS